MIAPALALLPLAHGIANLRSFVQFHLLWLHSVPSVAAITECALGSIRAHAVMVTPESTAGLSVQLASMELTAASHMHAGRTANKATALQQMSALYAMTDSRVPTARQLAQPDSMEKIARKHTSAVQIAQLIPALVPIVAHPAKMDSRDGTAKTTAQRDSTAQHALLSSAVVATVPQIHVRLHALAPLALMDGTVPTAKADAHTHAMDLNAV